MRNATSILLRHNQNEDFFKNYDLSYLILAEFLD